MGLTCLAWQDEATSRVTAYGLFVDMPFLKFNPDGLNITSFEGFIPDMDGTAGIPEVSNVMTRMFLSQSVSFDLGFHVCCWFGLSMFGCRQGSDCSLTDDDRRMVRRVCRSRTLHTPPLVAELYYGYVHVDVFMYVHA